MKVVIEIEFNPSEQALKSYSSDKKTLIEDQIEEVLKKILYKEDGYDIFKNIKLKNWAGTTTTITSSRITR